MIEIGRLLRSSINGCVVGCKASQKSVPEFGSMIRIPLEAEQGYQVFALVYDIHIDDDGFVRQLVTSEGVSQEVIMDNRLNRNVPLELSALFIGYQMGDQVFHLLPPRPPLTLDAIYPCDRADLQKFGTAGQFGYFRHILRAEQVPVSELLATHLRQMSAALQDVDAGWTGRATEELIRSLRDDYPALMAVLGALADARLNYPAVN